MSKNMSIIDRRARSLVVAPVAIVSGVLIGRGPVGAIGPYATAAIMLATSAVGYCPPYSLVRLDGPSAH
jgi:Inner membrane protein YgaP-like, transmembrane domain